MLNLSKKYKTLNRNYQQSKADNEQKIKERQKNFSKLKQQFELQEKKVEERMNLYSK